MVRTHETVTVKCLTEPDTGRSRYMLALTVMWSTYHVADIPEGRARAEGAGLQEGRGKQGGGTAFQGRGGAEHQTCAEASVSRLQFPESHARIGEYFPSPGPGGREFRLASSLPSHFLSASSVLACGIFVSSVLSLSVTG